MQSPQETYNHYSKWCQSIGIEPASPATYASVNFSLTIDELTRAEKIPWKAPQERWQCLSCGAINSLSPECHKCG